MNPTMASVEFQTIHSSKGLEADYVVVLGLTTGGMSFPSDMVDDPILELTRTAQPEMMHGEERRLFYVALTRAKRRVWLMLDADQPSPFAFEVADIGLKQGDVRW
ncbi:3'-5' exonuclease [Candidatus Poriferisodalis sp.]|uniref:3'-5' exonuclease n=1 Tax=Candidatus Poriferisodalis sp. TaxID=3101277 RepID=UPI003C6FA31E